MTTIDGHLTLTEVLATKVLRAARTKRERRTIPYSVWSMLLRLLLHLAGFSCLTVAGFTVSLLAGLVTAGLSCFVLSTLMTRHDNPPQVHMR